MGIVGKGKKSAILAAMIWAISVSGTAYAEEAEAFELDPVVVTATRTGQKTLDIAAETSVITSEDIERKGAITLADAIEGVPGVSISRYNGRGGTAVPYVNGTDMVVVMIDGVRINAVQGIGSGSGGVDLNRFGVDANAVERIEIVRGGNSALYGADAVGGVIQIFTKKGAKEYSSNFGVALGDDQQAQFKIGTTGSKDKWNWRFNGSYYDTDGYRKNGYSRNKDLSMHVGREANGGELFVNYNYSHIKAGHPGDIRDLRNPYIGNNGASGNQMFSIGYSKEDFTLQYYYKDRYYKGKADYYDWMNVLIASPFNHEESTHGIIYQDSSKLNEQHTLTWGTDMYVAKIKSSLYPDIGSQKRWKRSFYLQDKITFGKFILTPAALYEMNNDFDDKFLPKISGVYKLDTKTSIFANWGKIFRAPSFDDLYGAGTGRVDLRPETGWAAEAGLKKILNDKHEVSTSVFKRRLKDRIEWAPTANPAIWEPSNISTYSAVGFTLTWNAKFDKHFRTDLNYTYVDSDTDKSSSDWSEPRNQFHLGLHYDNKGFSQSVMLDSLSANDQYTDVTRHVGGRALVNTSTRYKLSSKQSVYLNLYNILDKDYSDTAGYPGNGRSFIVGWDIKF